MGFDDSQDDDRRFELDQMSPEYHDDEEDTEEYDYEILSKLIPSR